MLTQIRVQTNTQKKMQGSIQFFNILKMQSNRFIFIYFKFVSGLKEIPYKGITEKKKKYSQTT